MFNVSLKNPLEAETVSQRRERKARESEGSIRSSTSGSRARLGSERGSIAKKIPIFGFAKATKTRPAVPALSSGGDKPAAKPDGGDVVDDDHVDVDTGPSELAGSPVLVTSPSFSPTSYVEPLSGRSISPSVYRQEVVVDLALINDLAVASAPGRPAEEPLPPLDVPLDRLQQWGKRRSYVCADNAGRASYASPVEPIRLASPVQMERTSAAQAAKYRPERSDPASYVLVPGES
ncbi:hypothetical protein CLCR_10758 [Cladophialophora carrionii]|uniref:Uncharacterized protein n=1 Tax=Cladophialophora carrionii TaxID=86049 RepID=A0A1C1CZH1_9EURO|nr:hypothetical protein CLCR_10758 [Cladophialophora carrionii]